MFKKIIILVLVCISHLAFAQNESTQYIHKHLARVDASIVAGYLIKHNINNVHVDGSAEYYLDNIVSMRGSAGYMVGSSGLTKDSMGLKDFHYVYLGPVFHFHTNSHFDPYAIIQPGLAFTSSYQQISTTNFDESKNRKYYPGVLSPLGTVGLGFNYYFQRFAHLFVETRYVYGRHLTEAPSPISLQELRITFGLGFNLFLVREKKK